MTRIKYHLKQNLVNIYLRLLSLFLGSLLSSNKHECYQILQNRAGTEKQCNVDGRLT